MINLKNVKRFCCDDLSLIENYDEAMNDKTQTWVCHHKLEIELNLSADELIKRNLYDNRPASELIFMTRSDHAKMHITGERNPLYGKYGKDNPMYGKNPLDYMTEEAIKKYRRKRSAAAKDRSWLTNGIDRKLVKSELVDYYLERGYHLGRK